VASLSGFCFRWIALRPTILLRELDIVEDTPCIAALGRVWAIAEVAQLCNQRLALSESPQALSTAAKARVNQRPTPPCLNDLHARCNLAMLWIERVVVLPRERENKQRSAEGTRSCLNACQPWCLSNPSPNAMQVRQLKRQSPLQRLS